MQKAQQRLARRSGARRLSFLCLLICVDAKEEEEEVSVVLWTGRACNTKHVRLCAQSRILCTYQEAVPYTVWRRFVARDSELHVLFSPCAFRRRDL